MDENTPDEEGFVFVIDSRRNRLFKARECDGDIILCFQLKNRNEGERDVYLYKSEMDYQIYKALIGEERRRYLAGY